MADLESIQRTPITWKRAVGIFDDPQPPKDVWERQFDGFDEELGRLARTPHDEIDFSDLWYYHHDLAYVELQPDLFAYLFPVCLMDWHQTLMRNEACSHGDSEFHYGLHHGNVLHKMTTLAQRDAIYLFLRDSFLERVDTEQLSKPTIVSAFSAYGWMSRLNSVGLVMPRIDLFWQPWWNLDTAGQAVAALQYCSGLMYFEGDNPLFPSRTLVDGGGGPYLWENDSYIFHSGWLVENIDSLKSVLTPRFVMQKVVEAATCLKDEAESALAQQIVSDLESPTNQGLIEARVEELPKLLHNCAANVWSF